jgi:hypothetical protein
MVPGGRKGPHNRVRQVYICFNEKNLSKSFQETPDPKKFIFLKVDLMQSYVFKIMVPDWLWPQ